MSDDRTYDADSASIVVGREVSLVRSPPSVKRPAIGDMLAALADTSVGYGTSDDPERVVRSFASTFRTDVALTAESWRAGPLSGDWSVETPVEGVEALHTHGLWPWAPGDDASPRWWCERCEGRGKLRLLFGARPSSGVTRIDAGPHASVCPVCHGDDASPLTLAALVAVASLGVETLRAAEGLAQQFVGRAPRIAWRVMSAEAIALWADDGAGRPVAEAPQTIPQAARVAAVARSARWRDVVPDTRARWDGAGAWWLREAPADVAAAWPMVRDLTALGLHLVALDGDRVTLAVEAV